MAKIPPSALITAIQGKWNGSCFQMWKGAIVVRRNPQPRKIMSESRYNFRGTVSSLSGCFYSMTPNQRIAWRCYAVLLPTSVTGYNAFIARGTALELANHTDLCVYFNAPAAYSPPISPAPIALCYHPSIARYCVMWTNPNCASVYVQGMLSVQPMFSNENSPKWRIFDTVLSTDLHMIFDASDFPADQMIRFTARSINMRGEISIMAEAKPPPPLPESITLLYPNGGESLYTGASCLIEWRSKSTDNVKLEYSINDGVDWILITNSISAYLGQYSWTVPDTESASCKIKVTNTDDPTVYDESDAVFSIIDKPWVTLTAPNGSEEWEEDTKHNITWNHNNAVNVILRYSSDNGLSYNTITASTAAAPGTYEWTVPSDISTTCLVKILVHENQTIFDVSDNVFSITESTILSGCVAWWIFKTAGYDSGNSRFTDQTGNGRHATNYNGVVSADYTTLNGTDAYFNISDFFELSADSKEVTVFIFLKGSENDGGIFEHTYGPTSSYSWKVRRYNYKTYFRVSGTTSFSPYKQYTSAINILNNAIHSVCLNFKNGVLKCFIDGEEDTSVIKVNDDSFTSLGNSVSPIRIGKRYDGGATTTWLSAKIYKGFIYNKSLTDAEVLALHDAGS